MSVRLCSKAQYESGTEGRGQVFKDEELVVMR